jgi:hypothetical protein|tara:strand:- start:869 stop:1096 length:228 start_codon:yes stop_codon:yes gene_type:complete
MKDSKINRIIGIIREHHLKEEMPTMSMGHGKIAGSVEAGDDPPVRRKKKYMTGGHGSRKNWLEYLRKNVRKTSGS